MKKKGDAPPPLKLIENPDILAGLARDPQRPRLLIGFAAETEQVLDHAQAKLARKGCDWIVANDVSGDVMGGRDNTVHIIRQSGVESWDRLPKDDVARILVEKLADARPEERRVGKEGGSTCRSPWEPTPSNKKKKKLTKL